jgi:hypothetical protein
MNKMKLVLKQLVRTVNDYGQNDCIRFHNSSTSTGEEISAQESPSNPVADYNTGRANLLNILW